jgi:hypothetical protein
VTDAPATGGAAGHVDGFRRFEYDGRPPLLYPDPVDLDKSVPAPGRVRKKISPAFGQPPDWSSSL